MTKYLIERDVSGIHQITTDKTSPAYLAEDEAAVREHPRLSGFPANAITEVNSIMDPTTGKAR